MAPQKRLPKPVEHALAFSVVFGVVEGPQEIEEWLEDRLRLGEGSVGQDGVPHEILEASLFDLCPVRRA